MAISIADILRARRGRLIELRSRAVAEAARLQAGIDSINDALAAITPADEAKFAAWQELVKIRIED